MTHEERKQRIEELMAELRELYGSCPHEIAVPPDFWEKLKKDQWHSAGANCIGCGMDFGWFCPESPDHICKYEENDTYSDSCIFCGMPEERK